MTHSSQDNGRLKLFALEEEKADDGAVGEAGERHDAQSLGAAFRAAREERGLTLEDAAEGVRIQRRHLEALEAGDPAALPGAAYAAPFARSYARFLNMDEEAAAGAYAASANPRDAMPMRPGGLGAAKPPRLLYAGLIVVFAIGGFFTWVFFSPETPGGGPADSVRISEPAGETPEGAADGASSTLGFREGARRTEPVTLPDARLFGPGDPALDPTLKAVREAWIRLETRTGAVAFIGELRPGDRIALPRGGGHVVSLRDAGAFDLYEDGAFVEVLGADGRTIANLTFERRSAP